MGTPPYIYYRFAVPNANSVCATNGAGKGHTMLYTIIITTKDGKTATHTTQADTAKQAHEHGAQFATNKGDTIRVYATTQDEHGNPIVDGVRAGALMIVRRTTANIITREGNPQQYELYNQARTPHPENNPDIADMLSVATLAILTAINEGEPINEQYHSGYKALNNYLYSMRAIRIDERPAHIYFEDINGDIINVNGGINKILRPDERYTPEPDTDKPTAKQRQAIKNITATLTPTQTAVLKLLAKGYSQRQIAQTLKRSVSTINEHIKLIRKKAVELYPNGVQ